MNKLPVTYSRTRDLFNIDSNFTLYKIIRFISAKAVDKTIEECCKLLQIPVDSKQTEARQAFLKLAKKYHPDSGSPDADIEKFVAIENAFRILTKHNTGASSSEDVEKIVFDIRHTAPQHRQYLSYEGVGYGTPFQRSKQWSQARAQRASENVMEYRIAKTIASDNTLMKKGQYGQKHDIKTKYGFDRLVEDLIQESMSKGEFEKLSGIGKPLKNQNINPYVDFTTHKLNEVLINNGFTPEWITMSKDIDQDIEALREEIRNERKYLGPYPLSSEDAIKWQKIYESNKDLAQSINCKINKYNLIVPLISKQKFHVLFDEMCDDILKNGTHSVEKPSTNKVHEEKQIVSSNNTEEDFVGVLVKAIGELFSFKKKKNYDD